MLDRLQRRLGRFAVPNLMTWITIGVAIVYFADSFMSVFLGSRLSYLLYFNRAMIFRGQIWRLLSFIFVPASGGIMSLVISLYFYWMIGSSLERQWGTFRFNAFYLCGMLLTVIAGLITGYTNASFLNMSMFLAYALMWPEAEVLLFFMLPVKVKYLALIDVVLMIWSAVQMGLTGFVMLAAALINLALFFRRDAVFTLKNAYRRYQWKQNWKK